VQFGQLFLRPIRFLQLEWRPCDHTLHSVMSHWIFFLRSSRISSVAPIGITSYARSCFGYPFPWYQHSPGARES
jgi:hypothetical protein